MSKPIKLFMEKSFPKRKSMKDDGLQKAMRRKWEGGVEMLMQMKLEWSILTIIMSTYMINESIYPHNPLQQVNI